MKKWILLALSLCFSCSILAAKLNTPNLAQYGVKDKNNIVRVWAIQDDNRNKLLLKRTEVEKYLQQLQKNNRSDKELTLSERRRILADCMDTDNRRQALQNTCNNTCEITKLRLTSNALKKELENQGLIPGVRKASW